MYKKGLFKVYVYTILDISNWLWVKKKCIGITHASSPLWKTQYHSQGNAEGYSPLAILVYCEFGDIMMWLICLLVV